jgi:hypothetical protein
MSAATAATHNSLNMFASLFDMDNLVKVDGSVKNYFNPSGSETLPSHPQL